MSTSETKETHASSASVSNGAMNWSSQQQQDNVNPVSSLNTSGTDVTSAASSGISSPPMITPVPASASKSPSDDPNNTTNSSSHSDENNNSDNNSRAATSSSSPSSSSNDPSASENVILHPIPPTNFGPFLVSAATHIGRRKNQEDRFTLAPQLLGGELAFFGVFDGTVQEHASEWVHRNVVRKLLQTPSYAAFVQLTPEQRADRSNAHMLMTIMRELYASVDKELIQFCAQNEYHYSSCTSVTVLIHIPSRALIVAHLADSHAVVGLPDPDTQQLQGYFLTSPHRPDQPAELKRIQAAGGSLVYLHTNKPFIRGGDFHNRKLAMQLNYSRAFGGKDLKMYGLSAVPDVKLLDVRIPRAPPSKSTTTSSSSSSAPAGKQQQSGDPVSVLLLGSDGLWDVVGATAAVKLANDALQNYQREVAAWNEAGRKDPPPTTPTSHLVQLALDNHVKKGSNDNVTCIAVYF